MTEDEAKTKWCPMARTITPVMQEAQCTNGTWDFRCIASDCMMWRWKLDVRFAEMSKTDGHCGLAE